MSKMAGESESNLRKGVYSRGGGMGGGGGGEEYYSGGCGTVGIL